MDAAIDVEAKAVARLCKAALAEVVAKDKLARARFRTWNNCPKEEALYAAAVAETKAAAKAAVAATKAVVDAEWAE